MNFQEFKLSKFLTNALEEQEISTPTTIQQRAIPTALSGKDIIGVAQTGTGKTLAYLLPVLRDLSYSNQRFPRVLILTPTRELAVQVATEIEKLTKYMSVRTLAIYGGTNINTQKQLVHEGSDIIVATPGRLYDLAMTGVLRLKDIQKLVLDECDEMLNLGFRPQLERIFDLLPEKRQNLLFSATLTEEVKAIIDQFVGDYELVEAAPTGTPLDQIEQTAFSVPNFNTKKNFLIHLLKENPDFSKLFIFVKSKAIADLIHEELESCFPEKFGVIHSNKSQNYRLRVVEEIRNEELRGIIATDLVARGIDIENVTHVINFDIPDQPEQYIHRIGRTGRVGLKGNTLSFVSEKEQPFFHAIQQFMRLEIELQKLPSEVEISTQLIPEEEELNIHDAPTLVGKTIDPSQKKTEKKSQPKITLRNIKPKERKNAKKRRNRRKRR